MVAKGGNKKTNPPPPEKLAPELAVFIKSIQKLGRLVFVVPEDHAEVFALQFAKDNILLPQVETLFIGPRCEFAIKLCPNIKAIATREWRWMCRADVDRIPTENLLKAIESAENLTQIKITEIWSVSLLKGRLI